jgi:hypothetical protein
MGPLEVGSDGRFLRVGRKPQTDAAIMIKLALKVVGKF